MKKNEIPKPPLQILTDDEFFKLIKSVSMVDDYLMLFKSCSTNISRNYVILNAESQLEFDEYTMFLKLCIDHIFILVDKTLNLDKRKDENFIY